MKYRNWIIMLVIISVLLGVGVYFIFYNLGEKQNKESNYQTQKTETEVNNNQEENKDNKENGIEKQEIENNKESEKQAIETEIASFSTKILTKDNSRQKNISITCNTLNDTIVESGSTFSFCNTVGQATTNKGYEKADVFDAKRKSEKRTWWR